MREVASSDVMSAAYPQRGDEHLLVHFDTHPVLNEQKTADEGRPIYEEKEYITIMVPGDRNNIVHRPIWADPMNNQADTRRFARQYADWKAGRQGENADGTPLAAWPMVTKSQVEELRFFGVQTVEQLASLSDGNAQRFSGIQKLKQQAGDFLAAAKDASHLTKMRAELDARDNQITTQAEQIKALQEAVDSLRKNASGEKIPSKK